MVVRPQPTAAFTLPTFGCEGQSVSFANNSTITAPGVITTTRWDFGDNATANTSNPTHTYTTAGLYTVRLVVGTTLGCTDTISDTLRIRTAPNLSVPNATLGVCLGDSVTLTATSAGFVSTQTYADNFDGLTFKRSIWLFSTDSSSGSCGTGAGAKAMYFGSSNAQPRAGQPPAAHWRRGRWPSAFAWAPPVARASRPSMRAKMWCWNTAPAWLACGNNL